MLISGKKLNRKFYLAPTLEVARRLIGKTIIYNHPKAMLAADIVETEAYIGEDDPACHAAKGRTRRNSVMFESGGHSYVYFIYGMYHCFNIVTERKGFPAAVLIRAVEPVSGGGVMVDNSPPQCKKTTDGPGKFCRAFGLGREHNGIDLTGDLLYLVDDGKKIADIGISERIGIRKGSDRKWRFYDGNSLYLSRR